MSAHEFEDISIPKWKLNINSAVEGTGLKIYRVFSSENEFVTVQADNATDAVQKSGMKKIHMIRVGAQDDMSMLERSMLTSVPLQAPIITDTI